MKNLLKSYLNKNYDYENGEYIYKYPNMFGKKLVLKIDLENRAIFKAFSQYNYYSEEHAIRVLHYLENELFKARLKCFDGMVLQPPSYLKEWVIKSEDTLCWYESKLLNCADETISVSFYLDKNGMLGATGKYSNFCEETRPIQIPYAYPCENIYAEEVLAFIWWHIQQNPFSMGLDKYYKYSLNLKHYDFSYKELQKHNTVNSLTLKQKHIVEEAGFPLLIYSDRCFVEDNDTLLGSQITYEIEQIMAGNSAIDNIEIFKDCPYLSGE